MISSSTRIIALIGNPVRHSLSPKIQNYFISKYSKDAVYMAFEFPRENLKEAFNGAKKLGFMGLNVTMPYKEEVFKLIDRPDTVSSIIKSVNTVRFDQKDGTSMGFNTDVGSFIKSLDDKKFKWAGKHCLVIGAGGAARSSIYGILTKQVKKIYVYDKIKEKGSEIINNFKIIGSEKIEVLNSINDIGTRVEEIDLIVNCTPMGMDIESYKNMLPVPVGWNLRGKFVFDMVYKPVETEFLKKAKREGAIVINGIDMLVNQAALSFKVWFDIIPETDYIKKMILDNIRNNLIVKK
ncbi:MAG: shikimate dehydrogenase [Actinobacteria bacterium]|nr:shikimate dehydrogenase [Actinomycetota bacterium]